MLIQFNLPDVLCRLNQSHVCARIWQQLLHQMWMTHLCHFHPNPLYPVEQKKMAFLNKFSYNYHNFTILTAHGVEVTYCLLHFLVQMTMTCRPCSWSMITISHNIPYIHIHTPPQALGMSCEGCIKSLGAWRSIITFTHTKKIRHVNSIFIYNTLSGSDHNRSHSSPWSGTSVGLMIRRICSILCRSGLRPPWQQKIFSSTIAATGRQLKQSVNVFQSLILYRRLPTNNYSH